MKKMQKNLVLALIAMMILSIASVAYAEAPALYVEVNQEDAYYGEYSFGEQGTVVDGQIQIQVDGTVVNGGNNNNAGSNANANNMGLVIVDVANVPSIRSEVAPAMAPEHAPAIRAEIAVVPQIVSEASSRSWQDANVDANSALNLVAQAQSRTAPEMRPEIIAETREVVIVDEMVPLSSGVADSLVAEINADAPHYEDGQIVTLSATVRGGNGSYDYQWMVDRKDGKGFVELEGQTGATHRFTYNAAKLGFSWCVAVNPVA